MARCVLHSLLSYFFLDLSPRLHAASPAPLTLVVLVPAAARLDTI